MHQRIINGDNVMNTLVYRYQFEPHISINEVRDTLRLAASATQSVYGRRRLLLDADFDLSEADRACWIDATDEVGRHLHQVFRGFVVSEFPPHSFTVSKVSQPRIPDIPLAV